MASEKMKDKGYVKWIMKQENPTGPVLQFKKYILSHRSAETPTTPPVAAPPFLMTPVAAPPSPVTPGADPSLLRKLDRLERKVDALTELVRCLMTGEEPPSATEATPAVTPAVPEPSALETLG